MMQKWTSLVAATAIVVLLAGCSANANPPQAPQDSVDQQTPQPVETADNPVVNESIPFTSLEELKEIYAITKNNSYQGVAGANTVSINPELQKFVNAPVHITQEGFDSLSLEDRKLYAKILLRYMDVNAKELGLLTDSDGIKLELTEIPGYWLVMPETLAGSAAYYWPKDNHWGPEPFSPDTPKR